MGRGFRHAFAVVVLVVALMSGILSLIREFLLFQYPNKFQEPPLFWGCLRIAFGISLVFFWYEERRKRVLLEKSLAPTPSLKEKVLNLSQSILEFAYARSAAAPQITTSARYGADEDWHQRMEDYNREFQAKAEYEKATLGMYDYKYKRLVADAIVSLRDLSLDCSKLETYTSDLSNDNNPEYNGIRIVNDLWIKQLGKELESLADQINEAATGVHV